MKKTIIYTGHAIIILTIAYVMLGGPSAPLEASGSTYFVATGNLLLPEEALTLKTVMDESRRYDNSRR
jgi:hypothetical protein